MCFSCASFSAFAACTCCISASRPRSSCSQRCNLLGELTTVGNLLGGCDVAGAPPSSDHPGRARHTASGDHTSGGTRLKNAHLPERHWLQQASTFQTATRSHRGTAHHAKQPAHLVAALDRGLRLGPLHSKLHNAQNCTLIHVIVSLANVHAPGRSARWWPAPRSAPRPPPPRRSRPAGEPAGCRPLGSTRRPRCTGSSGACGEGRYHRTLGCDRL